MLHDAVLLSMPTGSWSLSLLGFITLPNASRLQVVIAPCRLWRLFPHLHGTLLGLMQSSMSTALM